MEENNAFLVGERIYLRPVEKGDLALIRKWANDPELRCLTGETTPMTQAGAEEYFYHRYSDFVMMSLLEDEFKR